METLAIRDLSFSYPGQTQKALDHVSFTVRQGEFWVLCGPSGSGKSTLLSQLKTILAPHGISEGEIWFEGRLLENWDQRQQSQRIGFVQQSPEDQIITDKVWHELAFGLESLGLDTPTIRRRVAEMASFFGIQGWFYKDVSQLSGGQKQLLNLAAVMAMQPSVLILDEPTSQLDPIAAGEFLNTLKRLNQELGITILLSEHRLEDAMPLADHVAVMDSGQILFAGLTRKVGDMLRNMDHPMFLAMPTAVRVWAAALEQEGSCPITVREGQTWLEEWAKEHPVVSLPPEEIRDASGVAAIQAKELWFRYERNAPDTIKGLSLAVDRGEFLALLGGNGTGKTTALKLLSGAEKPYRGQLQVRGEIGVLPQEPQTLFLRKTLRDDLWELAAEGYGPEAESQVARVTALCHLTGLLDRHPYDLSGGEQQRAALAKLLLLSPDILLLDEPTKGLDAVFKQELAQLLEALSAKGVTILMVSHDIEFCARYAHRCAMLFDGSIIAQDTPRAFFSGNRFYTTAANRMGRTVTPQAITPEDLITVIGGVQPPKQPLPPEIPHSKPLPPKTEDVMTGGKDLPWWRKGTAIFFVVVSAAFLGQFLGLVDLSALLAWIGVTNRATQQLLYYAGLCFGLMAVALTVTRGRSHPVRVSQAPRKLPRSTVLSVAVTLLLIPVTLFVGEVLLEGQRFYFIMLLVLLECMIPFFLVFEGRRPQARELVLVAALCAIGVAGRTVLIMLPQFKPVVALAIIAGVAFGGETGFLVGAVTMLASNALLGQGPYTPWQMFATGLIGFLGGSLFHGRWLRCTRISLCCFGALATLICYGGIMNFQSALQGTPGILEPAVILSYYVTGFPMDCIHAAATWIFLWFGGELMLGKLERIRVKYGLFQ